MFRDGAWGLVITALIYPGRQEGFRYIGHLKCVIPPMTEPDVAFGNLMGNGIEHEINMSLGSSALLMVSPRPDNGVEHQVEARLIFYPLIGCL